MSLSRKSNIVSLNSKMKRSMSSLSLFKAPRIRRKRKKGGLGKGIEPQTLSFEGEIDFDLKVLGSKEFVDLRYQDPAQVIYTEWRKSNKTKCRLNADEHYKMSHRHCKQM
ncbi:uncharacterized protein LOC134820768 [Bolinopsis microptera]|uniref:uncharacterized protein LOC134820768 n=1 Tax=Bolinopsis microptera TaxID=2820187 RepID=UPI0030792A28